ncbi:Fic family protein [Fibrobacterales bacterium]|nr:Fic family protein [Fibrobacterales bacterium]
MGVSYAGNISPMLRRENQIKTIQASLEIEGNSLNIKQVTAVLNDKAVMAPPQDILEVKNALSAYQKMQTWNSNSEQDLLDAHHTLMQGLITDSGKYRQGSVGVSKGEKVIHIAPPAPRVPQLIKALFEYIDQLEFSPLIKSCIFHYEFEYIHPFTDGNGRLGRLWQTLILSEWKDFFIDLPLETVIRDNQEKYYAALNRSNVEIHPGYFVEFILEIILKALENQAEINKDTPLVSTPVTPLVKKLLILLKSHKTLAPKSILEKFKLKSIKSLCKPYLKPTLDLGLIEYTIPEKPTSRIQEYRLTELGLRVLNE